MVRLRYCAPVNRIRDLIVHDSWNLLTTLFGLRRFYERLLRDEPMTIEVMGSSLDSFSNFQEFQLGEFSTGECQKPLYILL